MSWCLVVGRRLRRDCEYCAWLIGWNRFKVLVEVLPLLPQAQDSVLVP